MIAWTSTRVRVARAGMAGVLGDSFLNIWEPDVRTKEAPAEEVKSQEEIAAFTVRGTTNDVHSARFQLPK